MKKRFITLGLLILGGLALILPSAISLKSEPVAPQDDFVDPIEYDESDEKIARLDVPYKVHLDEEEEVVTPSIVRLHYHNDDNACLGRRFYTWVTGVDGVERTPNLGDWTATDMAIELDYSQITEYQDSISLFFIIKVAGTWSGQSEDTVLSYSDYEIVDGVLEVWTIPGEGSSIEIYATQAESQLPKIQTAKFVDFKTIHCVCTTDAEGKEWAPISYKLYAFDKSYFMMTEASQKANKDFYLFKESAPGASIGHEFDIKFNYTAKINVQYLIESIFPGFETKTQKVVVSSENLYEDLRFEKYYTYTTGNDLGVTYTSNATTFKVWSPISSVAWVNIYDNGAPKALGGSDVSRSYPMAYTKGGVWELTILGNLEGKFYTYSLTHSSGTVEAMDPYAKACGINGLRGYIYDSKSSAANPEGWDTVPLKWDGVEGYDIKTTQDLSIYEIHIRDLTMDETWVSNKGNKRGTYDAFAEKGTSYSKNGKTVTTGYDHIEELGVKAIQILPVFDNDNDEREGKMKFNWGYNPLNYNCVDGGYSNDPTDPLSRIKEYKNLIKAYSENINHTRVIMDVVYNHVSSASSSCFTKVMPKYYFRYDAKWNYYDGSGCSNEVKSDATMMRKYIVDSLLWWATEYKVKGFRFDLMGLIDTWTLREAKEALYELDPDIAIYGEGWTSGGYHGKYAFDNTPQEIVDDETDVVTYTVTNFPDWIPNDGAKVFAWCWGGLAGNGKWRPVNLTYDGSNNNFSNVKGTFLAPQGITGFNMARCSAPSLSPSWEASGDNSGRVYNKTADITVTSGVTSYTSSAWEEYPGGEGSQGILVDGGAENDLIYRSLAETETSKGYVGGFNNGGRDSAKGSNDRGFSGISYPEWGYISKGDDVGDLSYSIADLLKGKNSYVGHGKNPVQTINYMSCHDNYTLWDQLRYTLSSSFELKDDKPIRPTGEPSVKDTINASLACHAAVFMSNGASFIQGGEELYRTKSYNYDEADLAKLMQGGAEAVVRPYPDYVHYSTDPDVIQATAEVWMYGEVISHNSYKSPDYVNSFKWDRKIEINGQSTYEYNDVWVKMIHAKNDIQHASYTEIYEQGDTSKVCVEGAGTGSSIVGGWARTSATQGYRYYFAGRKGGSLPRYACSEANLVYANNKIGVTYNSDSLTLAPYTFVVYKING